MQVTVEIPDDIANSRIGEGQDASRVLLEAFAAESYREGKLTMEQVRRLLGFGTRMHVDAFLQRHEVYDYTVNDLETDLATLAKLRQPKEPA